MNMIEKIERRHLEAVAEIESLCFSEPWSIGALELLLGESATGVVALSNGEVTAYGGMLIVLDEGQITNIAVHPAHRRCGYGKQVLDALLGQAKQAGLQQISLEVRASNLAAISLYEKAGFFSAGRRKNFYRHPTEDGLVMLKTL